MPIYTYRCNECGVQFERRQKFNDPPLVRCPECDKKALRKVYLPVGIVFKGSGFYSTDNRSPSGQSWKSKDSKSDDQGKTSSSETSKESKTSDD